MSHAPIRYDRHFRSLLLASSAAPAEPTQDYELPPGEGVICAWALNSAMAEIAAHCTPGRNVEIVAELRRSSDMIESYIRANSDLSEDEIARFRLEQGHVGVPEAVLCRSESVQMVEALDGTSVEEIRSSTDRLLARPGRPTWGACV